MAYSIVRVEGASRMRSTLRRAGVRASQMAAVNRAAAGVVVGAGRSSAPRRSGRLAASVRTAGTTASTAVVSAGRKSVPYAAPIHWGWAARNIEAQPWLSLAAQASEPRWITEYYDHMDRLVQSVEGA